MISLTTMKEKVFVFFYHFWLLYKHFKNDSVQDFYHSNTNKNNVIFLSLNGSKHKSISIWGITNTRYKVEYWLKIILQTEYSSLHPSNEMRLSLSNKKVSFLTMSWPEEHHFRIGHPSSTFIETKRGDDTHIQGREHCFHCYFCSTNRVVSKFLFFSTFE